jgi:dUTP pyrophosphatase
MNFLEKIVKIYKLYPDVQDISFATQQSACFDISAYLPYQASVRGYTKANDPIEMLNVQDTDGKNYIEIPSEWRVMIPTGLILDIPEYHCIKIYSRSGLSTKKGLNLINSVGIIDSDYVEQLYIPIYNNSQSKARIYNGDRIAQGKLEILESAQYTYINERPTRKSDRDGGFGSTGISEG